MENSKFGKFYPVWSKLWEKPLNPKKRTGSQLYTIITNLIRSSDLLPEMRLPPIYLLSAKLGISSSTVSSVYKRLKKERLLLIYKGRGVYVSPKLPTHFMIRPRAVGNDLPQVPIEMQMQSASCDNFIVLGSVSPDSSRIQMGLYLDYLAHVQREIVKKKYNADDTDIRDEITAAVRTNLESQGIPYADTTCRLIPSNQVLACIIGTLVSSTDTVVMDSPNDFVPLAYFEAANVRVSYCADGAGVFDLNKLRQICETNLVRLVFVRPSASFPFQHCMKEADRNRLVDLSVHYSFLIVSLNDTQGWFHKQPLAPLFLRKHVGNVIYVAPFHNLLNLTRAVSMVVGPPALMMELDRQVFLRDVQVRLDEMLYAARLYNRSWLDKDTNRLLVSYQQLQKRIVRLHKEYLSSYTRLRVSIYGIRFYLELDRPLPLNDACTAQLTRLGMFQLSENFHANLALPVQGFCVGYANMTIGDIESFFILLRDNIRAAASKW